MVFFASDLADFPGSLITFGSSLGSATTFLGRPRFFGASADMLYGNYRDGAEGEF